MQETWVRSLGCGGPLEKEMVTHPSILAWRIPWIEEPGGLRAYGYGVPRVRHSWATNPAPLCDYNIYFDMCVIQQTLIILYKNFNFKSLLCRLEFLLPCATTEKSQVLTNLDRVVWEYLSGSTSFPDSLNFQ